MTTELIDRPTLARRLGVSPSLLSKWATHGGGPVMVKLGARRVGYRPEDVAAWLERQARATTADSGAK
jgi:predicted DNA-binding transcriptional regulator AlpA